MKDVKWYVWWYLLMFSLQWRHNKHDAVSNRQPHDCLLNHPFMCKPNKTSKPRDTGLCAGNSPVTGEFPAQMASNAKIVSIWWRRHDQHLLTQSSLVYICCRGNESSPTGKLDSMSFPTSDRSIVSTKFARVQTTCMPLWNRLLISCFIYKARKKKIHKGSIMVILP